MRTVASAVSLVVVGSCVLALSTARADTLEAPAEIMAQADGTFHYTVTFTKGPGSGMFAGNAWYGVENVQGGLFGDCFCLPSCPIWTPGFTFSFSVDGSLTNPTLPGSVAQDVSFCDAGSSSSTTLVRAFDPASVPPSGIVAALWNEPNPFSTRTTFYYRQPEAGPVSLALYDVSGRLVARVVNEVQSAGPHEVKWDARASAESVRGGVLFARLAIPGQVLHRTLILVP